VKPSATTRDARHRRSCTSFGEDRDARRQLAVGRAGRRRAHTCIDMIRGLVDGRQQPLGPSRRVAAARAPSRAVMPLDQESGIGHLVICFFGCLVID
jgi:hypothetical protein